ncbi:MAG: hypothetical protein HONBIEJF_00603 [Fimbriimonadaceae bacterium]|nr:hypothetical protein [Fimbriimonadaceae bacterium]
MALRGPYQVVDLRRAGTVLQLIDPHDVEFTVLAAEEAMVDRLKSLRRGDMVMIETRLTWEGMRLTQEVLQLQLAKPSDMKRLTAHPDAR